LGYRSPADQDTEVTPELIVRPEAEAEMKHSTGTRSPRTWFGFSPECGRRTPFHSPQPSPISCSSPNPAPRADPKISLPDFLCARRAPDRHFGHLPRQAQSDALAGKNRIACLGNLGDNRSVGVLLLLGGRQEAPRRFPNDRKSILTREVAPTATCMPRGRGLLLSPKKCPIFRAKNST
jgi:hypothetical protein